MPHSITTSTREGNDTLGPDSTVFFLDRGTNLRVGFLKPIEGLFPRDTLLLVLAFFAIAEERPFKAIVVVDILDHIQATQT